MTKKTYKIYLNDEDYKKLQFKAGFGRGAVSHYIEKIARESIVFLDDNTKTMLKALDLK